MRDMSEAPITVRGDVEERAIAQLRRCAAAGDATVGVLCADAHVGYSQPIGGAVAYPDHISPSGVGYDIGCLAAGTPVTSTDGWSKPIEDIAAGDPVACWDTHDVRTVAACDGAIARGTRAIRTVTLTTGRTLGLTDDHLVRTKLGWTRADALAPGDLVACSPFVGVPFERPEGTIDMAEPLTPPGARRRDRAAALRARGLWPLRCDDPRLPALLRALAYCAGDGNLGVDGKSVAWFTSVEGDAADLAADLALLGFRSATHRRGARAGAAPQHTVLVRSVELHALFAALGCPVGTKVYAWPDAPFPWLFALPRWLRAVFLSAFMSAEGSTPALAPGTAYVAALAVKQSGVTTAAIAFVARLFASLDFAVTVTPSGPARADGRQSSVAQLQGGEAEILRYLREVGYNRACGKREQAAAMVSIVGRRETMLATRAAAIAEAQRLRAVGASTIRAITADVSGRFGVPVSLVHHGLYGRGEPRAPKGWRPTAEHSGEVAWLAVVANAPANGVEPVFDVVTGDAAACFLADGAVVHNCGNKAVRTDLRVEDVRGDLPRIMDDIFDRISFGVGRKNAEPVDHPVLERIAEADFAGQRGLRSMAAGQLGTVGAGNHYVDLFAGDDGLLWVGVHFGSRGFGHKTASGFLALAAGRRFDERGRDGEMDAPPVLLHVDSALGQDYVAAMQLAGEYAYAGRDVVVDKVLEILGATATYDVHNHHNFAWRERHGGTDVWVVRKGCTPPSRDRRGSSARRWGSRA
jgi:RNA-splicing ligase RtcB